MKGLETEGSEWRWSEGGKGGRGGGAEMAKVTSKTEDVVSRINMDSWTTHHIKNSFSSFFSSASSLSSSSSKDATPEEARSEKKLLGLQCHTWTS